MSQYTSNHSFNCANTRNTHSYNNVWSNHTVADDRSELLAWLSPLDPGLRHVDIQEHRVNGVGEWLIQTEEFGRWCGLSGEGDDDKAVLFCYGNPGVGKTFISSLVVDKLCDQSREQNTSVTCFYFDFAARKEQTATSMLGSLLKQIISGMGRIPEDIRRALRKHREAVNRRRPQLSDMTKMLQLVTSSQPIFMVIDALDECTAVQRYRLFDSLKEILEKSTGARIFVTGRPHIHAEVEVRLAGQVTSISVSPTRDDIIRFLRVRLSEDETPESMDERLEADILEKLPGNIPEMFLLVSLNIEAILKESTISRRRERLSKMTYGLGLEDVYGTTVERIKAQGWGNSRLGMGALMWISHAERPLRADELCHALAVELGSTDFDPGNVPSISTLMSCCQGLIVVDKEVPAVRLIHPTLQRYLSTYPDIFSRPQSAMAEICLTYLNSGQVNAISANPSPDILNSPFLEYCSVYWGVHAKKELSDHAKSLALELLQQYDGHISSKLLLDQARHLYVEDFSVSFRFDGLHCTSLFGIVEVAYALIQLGVCDINSGDFGGYTPLAWAARNGHDEMVKMLLEGEMVDPDKPDNSGQTPLSHAAGRGHDGVVQILLGREEVGPDRPNNYGLTPLLCAAHNGHERVVKTLLGSEEVNPDKPNHVGVTPLSYAARGGHEEVVKILLNREEVNPDKPNNHGLTPLSCAAHNGHDLVVKMLLERGEVNPDQPNCAGVTPLSSAARNGHEGVVRMLLWREDVDPNKPNNYGLTPLSCAAHNGHEGVVKMLLERKDVDPNRPNCAGVTPLSGAARNGHEGVVKMLLEREDVNPGRHVTAHICN